MGTLHKITPPRVKERFCPNCSFIIMQMNIERHRYDYSCPKCYKTHMSDFLPVIVTQ